MAAEDPNTPRNGPSGTSLAEASESRAAPGHDAVTSAPDNRTRSNAHETGDNRASSVEQEQDDTSTIEMDDEDRVFRHEAGDLETDPRYVEVFVLMRFILSEGKPLRIRVSDDKKSLPRGKCLFVCCDGTWNNAVGTQWPVTNVARLARGLPPQTEDERPQLVYYCSGVGTRAGFLGNLIQGAMGNGLGGNILNAYYFLCQNYSFGPHFTKIDESQPGPRPYMMDEIILVGFSRGGFTVRCLASFIDKVGLLRRIGLPFLNTLFKLWRHQNSKQDSDNLDDVVDALEKNHFLVKTKIKIVAEWDTVSAMGPKFEHITKRQFSFVRDEVPESVENVFQAISIHEERWSFKPMPYLRKKDEQTQVTQCAFAGCHSDIGGGNKDVGLSTLSLIWMVAMIRSTCSAKLDDRVMLGYFTPVAVNLKAGLYPSCWQRMYQFVTRDKPKTTFIRCSQAMGVLRSSHRGLWVLLKLLPFGLLRRKRVKYWPAFKEPLPLEVHWTVRMLKERYGLRKGCLPGYEAQQSHQQNGEPTTEVLPHDLKASQYYWRKNHRRGPLSTPTEADKAILHEFEPTEQEVFLYEKWFSYDGKTYTARRQNREKEDTHWKAVLKRLDLDKGDAPIASNRTAKGKPMRQWMEDRHQNIVDLQGKAQEQNDDGNENEQNGQDEVLFVYEERDEDDESDEDGQNEQDEEINQDEQNEQTEEVTREKSMDRHAENGL